MRISAWVFLVLSGAVCAYSPSEHLAWLREVKASSSNGTEICDACRTTITTAQDFFLYDYNFHSDGILFVTDVCEIAMPEAVCYNLVSTYAEVMIAALGSRYLDPQYVCSRLMLCDAPVYVKQNITEIVNEIMSDAPPVLPLPPLGNTTFKFLHVSDIHVDREYQTDTSIACPYPMCCRTEFGLTNTTSEKAGYWGSTSKCDLPLRTIEAFMKQASKMDIDFMLWTGDDSPHAIWEYVRETHLDDTKILSGMFKDYFPKTQIYPVMGNHAGFPQDQYHYGHEQWLTEGLTEIWADWLTASAQSTHRDNGYYSMKDPVTGLRMLVINTQMCDNMNFWLVLNDTDPGGHLQWLRQELYLAEASGEFVFIIGHIPVGDHFCSSTWATVYRAIVNRFRNIIRGQFFGHTHRDQFELVPSLTPGEPPAGVVYVVPGLTSFSYHAPVFRVFEVDKETLQLVNYYNYRLDIPSANRDKSTFPEYSLYYDPLSSYGMSDLSPASWAAFLDSMRKNETLGQLYSVHMNNPVPTVSTCDSACQEKIICASQTSVYDETVECSGRSKSDILFQMLEDLAGPWEVVMHQTPQVRPTLKF